MENTSEKCNITVTLRVLGGKWKILVLWHLIDKTQRFSELKYLVKGVTHKMLAHQLRELEADGLIQRKVYAEVPPRVEYSLTEYASTLIPVLKSMAEWGLDHGRKLDHQVANSASKG